MSSAPAAAGQFHGTATTFDRDQCIVLDRFPESSGAKYKAKDSDQEKKLCKIDFRDKNIGLCPKTWSTSPGTIVYDISQSKYAGKTEAFETEYCPAQRRLKDKVPGVQKLASYKQSINGQFNQRTSATFAQASPLYYHFSRYLNATVDVPVAVIRTMDAQEHFRRVTTRAHTIVSSGMIANGWNVVTSAEKNPPGYVPTDEFYYGDPRDGMLYGMMAKGSGARYGAEFYGNIVGESYSEQYASWQKAPAFLALASSAALPDAIDSAVASSRGDPVVAKALGKSVSKEQMVLWMKETADIFLLDYIFNQQDRPGNVDYLWVWYAVDANGKLQAEKVDSEAVRSGIDGIPLPDDLKQTSRHFLLQKTQANDNDAGARRYSNFTKKFGLLAKERHASSVTYRQLLRLSNDFQAKGPLYTYLSNTYDLSAAYLEGIAQNTIQAAAIMNGTCKSGSIKFDLDPDAYLTTGKAQETRVDCENP
jgi:hypothetical protein